MEETGILARRPYERFKSHPYIKQKLLAFGNKIICAKMQMQKKASYEKHKAKKYTPCT